MSDLSRKKPLAASLNAMAMQRSADAVMKQGQGLPCKVISRDKQIVTVSFEVANQPFTLPQVAMPIATSKYDWIPIEKDTLGVAIPADVYTGGVSGLGGGTADFPRRANLSTLQFVPIANKDWTPPGGDSKKNYRILQGPDGVRLQDKDAKAFIDINKDTGIVLQFNDHKIEIKSDGVYIDGKKFLTHTHTDVTTGSSNTGIVT